MGLFNRSTAQDQADAMRMAEDIVQGKGLMGKMGKAFLGPQATAALQSATASVQHAGQAAALRAAGVPARAAIVVNLSDTGQTVNGDPNVQLLLDLDGQRVTLITLLSRLEIPRIGEQVLVITNPQTGTLLYAGLAPRG